MVSVATVTLWSLSLLHKSFGQCTKGWVWLCPNKTLFTKAGGKQDVVMGMDLATKAVVFWPLF